MKTILTTILIYLAAMSALAQTADIKVSYVAHKPNFRDGKTDLTNQYILLANSACSKFYSPVTEYIDSLSSTPEGKARLQEISRAALESGDFDGIPQPDGTIYVIKSFTDGTLKHYDTSGLEKLVYEEPVARLDWNINDSTRIILGYECIMATADYHGRKWIAWFAPEIPLQNGPWKLDGLPGLILEATAAGGQYSFVATGIQQTRKPVGPVYLAGEYESTKRIDYLKAKRAFMDNPLGKINAQFGGKGKISVSSGDDTDLKQLFVPASVADFPETDYHP